MLDKMWDKMIHKVREVPEATEKNSRQKSGWRRFCYLLALGVMMTVFGLFPWYVQAQRDTLGELDPFTGELIQTEEELQTDTVQAVSGKVWITNNMYYDTEKKLYGYYAGDEDVYATVADGMIVRGKVSIQIPDHLTAVLYLDGYSAAFTGGELETPGSYTLEITDNGQTKQLFSYTIVNGITNQVLNYNMPDGFRIINATRDGEEISWTRNFVDMATEGRYRISYECSKMAVSYTLDLTVDTTPPTLVIEGLDENGKARGPVAITGKAVKL